VFYSTISGKPSVVPATHLIFHDISMRGFWLAKLRREREARSDHRDVRSSCAAGRVGCDQRADCGTYSFAEIAEAVAVASKKRGKALFTVG